MRTDSAGSKSTASPEDRRVEPRFIARGPVQLRTLSPFPRTVAGKLMDVSDSGFRVSHRDAALEKGELVEFSFTGREGRARIVWNRVQAGQFESGLWIMDSDGS